MKKRDTLTPRMRNIADVAIEQDKARDRVSARAQRDVRSLANSVRYSGRVRVSVLLGDLTAKTCPTTVYTHTWSVTYPAGGESVTAFDTLVPNFVAAFPAPGGGYTVTYDSALSKLKAWMAPGVEVVATTNLSAAIGTTAVLVAGASQAIRGGYVARGDEVLVRAAVVVEETVAKDATNPWTIEARRRSGKDEYGTRLGAAISNANRSFASRQEEVLYEAVGVGTRMAERDHVVLYASPASQSSLDLGQTTLVLDFQRKVT